MLNRLNIIACMDSNLGLINFNKINWEDSAFISILRQLISNLGVVATTCIDQHMHTAFADLRIHPASSINDILTMSINNNQLIYVMADNNIINEMIDRYAYLCDKVHIIHFKHQYHTNIQFHYDELEKYDIISDYISQIECSQIEFIETVKLNVSHSEQQYLNLLSKILTQPDKPDRTGTGTKSMFGCMMEFDLREGFPLFTTKYTWFDGIKKELLFFISGKTNTKILEQQGVNIWKGNTNKEYLKAHGLEWKEGDMGASYGHQWRHAGAEYKGCDYDYNGIGIDQLKNTIERLKNDPFGRRHVISAWNVVDIDKMVLPPCHCIFQFYVDVDVKTNNPTYLDCCLYQRSADMFLGIPFNVASYALLLSIIGKLTNLIPRKFIHMIGDAHIYNNHINSVKTQIDRTPYPFPTLHISDTLTNINSINLSDIWIENYKSHSKLVGKMAV